MRWATFQTPPATTERIGVVQGEYDGVRSGEIHGHESELTRGAALQEQDLVVWRYAHQLAQIRLGLMPNLVVPKRREEHARFQYVRNRVYRR